MKGITQHHNQHRYVSEWHERSAALLKKSRNKNNTSLPMLFTEEKIEHACSSIAYQYLDFFTYALLLGWPKEHCVWLLAHSAELHAMDLRMLMNAGKPTPITLAGRELFIMPRPRRYSPFNVWLDAVSTNLLIDDDQSVLELCTYSEGYITDNDPDNAFYEPQTAFFHLFKLYVEGGSSSEQKKAALERALALVERGAIEKINCIETEIAFQFLFVPFISFIARAWGVEESSLDDIVMDVLKASYEYHADYAPLPGEPTGDDSHELWDSSALIPRHMLACLRLHYRRTGETISFDSPYLPLWLIKGEGPTRNEVLFDNPVTFDEESVGLKKT
ncbi:immunity 49 family protein [Vibrio sp. Of7-15]|uniref:Imm49 family immunity protein n=1 Tax=Vibrio sp. Of7-15 TaxID=2724879 RepID=UPI001EF352FB|nr:Imm49 family immunity protein [Vibrio sp. Of7-15]MCG7495469.1 immunity 49 family protein [Vibrio sp. Of7-15]